MRLLSGDEIFRRMTSQPCILCLVDDRIIQTMSAQLQIGGNIRQ